MQGLSMTVYGRQESRNRDVRLWQMSGYGSRHAVSRKTSARVIVHAIHATGIERMSRRANWRPNRHGWNWMQGAAVEVAQEIVLTCISGLLQIQVHLSALIEGNPQQLFAPAGKFPRHDLVRGVRARRHLYAKMMASRLDLHSMDFMALNMVEQDQTFLIGPFQGAGIAQAAIYPY